MQERTRETGTEGCKREQRKQGLKDARGNNGTGTEGCKREQGKQGLKDARGNKGNRD